MKIFTYGVLCIGKSPSVVYPVYRMHTICARVAYTRAEHFVIISCDGRRTRGGRVRHPPRRQRRPSGSQNMSPPARAHKP